MIVLDTHVLVWARASERRLGRRARALLDRLWAHCAKPEFSWTHKWKVGDLLIWDNRCAIHRRDGFDGSQRRVMHRTQIKGGAQR